MEFRQRHLVNRPAFSLLEVLLTVSVVGILATMSVHGLIASRQRATMNREASNAEVFIRQAQQWAQTARDGRSWGIRCAGDRLEMFSYTETLLIAAKVTNLQANVRCQGSEVRFQKLTGQPLTPTIFVLEANSQAYKQIRIDAPGVITLSTV